jgi:hypothetical protein
VLAGVQREAVVQVAPGEAGRAALLEDAVRDAESLQLARGRESGRPRADDKDGRIRRLNAAKPDPRALPTSPPQPL